MSPVIIGTAAAGLFCIGRYDQKIVPGKKVTALVAVAGFVGSGLLRFGLGPGEYLPRLLLSVVMGCLLLACLTDVAIYRVHNFVWWMAGLAVVTLFFCRGVEGFPVLRNKISELLIFCTLQLCLFGKMYGKADCYAFCVCAAAEAGLGMGLTDFLTHMYFSFLILAVIQICRKNISRRGHLEEPVAFIPYITAGFYLIIIFHKIYSETVVPLS